MSSDTRNALVGTIIAERYRILKRVGEGGMGMVFLAEHLKMKRKCAIKIMRSALVGDAEALQRFTREAENASKLAHPNVASIFDFGETSDGLVYLVMEFIEGESLHATLDREVALHPMVAADIIGQSADALQAAHDLDILHRDLKPDNLMLSKRTDGTFLVKLVDFGIARTMDSGATRVTRTGFAVGTPEYMSPEQLSGDVLDARSDQYALALVAFAALTGEEAFADSTGKDSLILRLTSRPRRLAEVRTDIDWPVTLQSVFDRALAPDAADRYPRIADFADELSNTISLMTPTQTTEMYTRALMSRGAGAARRTPSLDKPVPAASSNKSKAPTAGHGRTEREVAVARPIGMPDTKRRRLFPITFAVVAFVYGLYWYGARQTTGTARALSDSIASAARTVGAPFMPLVARLRAAATDGAAAPAAAPVVTPKKRAVRAKPDSVKADSATRDSAPAAAAPPDTGAPPA